MKKLYSQSIRLLTLIVLLSSAAFTAKAQLNMTRQTFSGSYVAIDTSTGATLAPLTGDDIGMIGIPIGFTFNYAGTAYTTIGANTNGLAYFAASTSTSAANTDIVATATPTNALAAWWDDLEIDAPANLMYKTTGVPGSQVFTLQWGNVLSYYVTSTQRINFQVKLYEGTNVIEFHYGVVTVGTINTSESATIGLKGGVAGYGNFICGVTGSSFVSHSYMNSTSKWPTVFYRFSPGTPTPIAGGTYNVGIGQTYPTIDQAVADLNHRGITGPVVLNLTDANYSIDPAGGDNIFPVVFSRIPGASLVNTVTMQPSSGTATLSYSGSGGGNISLTGVTTTIGTTTEPIIAVSGTSFLNINNLNLVGTGNLVDRGLLVLNNSATLGSQSNAFRGFTISLDRTNTNTIGIEQRAIVTPTSVSGSNSQNFYLDLAISNTYNGIFLNGNGTFPDASCTIGNTVATNFNTIGSVSANDIGNGVNLSYGIRAANQNSVSIFQNEVRNVTVTGAVAADGILVETSSGTPQVYRNKVHDIKSLSTSSTTGVSGIRANLATTGTHTLSVFNNFVYNLSTAYTGAATATRQITGIFVQSAGSGAATSTIQVDNNSVAINHGTNPNASSSCFAIGTSSGPIMAIRNNIFANLTTGQLLAGVAYHAGWNSTSATAIGSAGSLSNNNDFYIPDVNGGYVGRGNAVNYATLVDWQTATTQDGASITVDPAYVSSSSDLHASGVGLNAAAISLGHVTVDIDNEARSGTPDIGADEFVLMTVDASAQSIASPLAGNCYTATETILVQIRNAGVSPLDFSVNPCVVTVNITGAITATLNFTVNNNSLNGGSPLASGATLNVPVGTANMSSAGTYTFNATVACTGDMNNTNDAMLQSSINFQAGTATVLRGNICAGDSSSVVLSGNSTSANIQWEVSTDGGATWSNVAGATSSSYMAIPSQTSWYRANVCGLLTSVVDTIVVTTVSNPVVTNDTVCGLDTLHLAASGSGTLNWYTVPTGGSILYTGTNLDTILSATDTFYVSNTAGGGIANVGMTTNAAGGGQQTSTAYNTFDVFQACTLVGTYVYPGAAGNVVCDLRDNAGALITSRTVAVGAGDVGNRTYIALNIPLTPGTGYRLAQGAGSVSMFRNSAGVTYPYTLPGVLSINGSSAGATFYYFFYDWQVLTGCESPRVAVEAVVNQAPVVTAAVSAATICQGDSTVLSASSVNAGYNYTWTPSATLSSATGASVTANPWVNTSYIVVGMDSAGCVNKDTVDVMVNTTPTTNFTNTGDTICAGDTVMISGAMGPFNYSDSTDVSVPDNTTQISTITTAGLSGGSVTQVCFNMTHTWDADMNFTLISPMGTTLDLSSGNGGSGDNFFGTCFDMSAGTSITAGTAPFTGSFLPEGPGGFAVFNGENLNGTWTLQMQDVATGDPGLLLDWSINFGGLTPSYSWSSTPAGFVDSVGTITVTPTVTTTYHLTLSDSATGCDTVYSHTVYVHPALAASIVAPSVACNGAALTLTANVTGGDGVYGYNWAGLSTSDSLNVVVTSDTTFTLDVFDGCGALVSDTVSILLAQPLNVTLLGPASVCVGDTIALMANAVGGDGNYVYVWNPNLSSSSVLVDVPSAPTTYSVSVTDGCNVSPAVANVSITITPDPVASFSFTGASLSYTFTNNSTDATTYAWDFGDGNTSTVAAPTHTYAADGVYQVCLVASSSCGNDTICQAITVVSTSKPFGNGVVQLWPNPARGQFNVRVEGFTGEKLNLELYSLSGQLVLVKTIDQVSTTIVETLNADLPAGTYYLRVNDGVNNATLRVVLE